MDETTWVGPGTLAQEVAIEGQADGARPDRRRARRAARLGEMLAAKPCASFPRIFVDPADLEAAYRFFNSDRFGWRDLLAPHTRCTVERASQVDSVVVAHDTTTLSMAQYDPETPRTFFAPLSSRKQGMHVHAGLAIGFGAQRPVPLGILNLQPYVHRHEECDEAFQSFWREQGGWYEHEMARWFEGVQKSEEALRTTGKKAIHVMDREADSYGLIAFLQSREHAFVVRVVENNRRDGETGLELGEALDTVPFVAKRTVRLGARTSLRGTTALARHVPRKERDAELHFRAKKIVIKRPDRRSDAYAEVPWRQLPETLEVNVVQALEVSPPEDDSPVQWLLLTTEPVETAQDIVRVVDLYRARWLIEEFFKTLKTGCAIEKRQLESAEPMLKALALTIPVAWQLLLTRHLADTQPDLPWRSVLQEDAFQLLQAKVGKKKLPDDATVLDVLYQIAAIGGHRKNNGPPGWQTLARGMETLLEWMQGAALARELASLINP